MTVSEAFALFDMYKLANEDYSKKSRTNYRTAANSFIRLVGDIPINYIGVDHIIQWKIAMREHGLQDTSRNTNISKFRTFFKYLREEAECNVLDYRKITRDKEEKYKPKQILTPQEVVLLVENAKTRRDQALIAMYFGTGCRLSELLGVDREDFEKAKLVEDNTYEIWVFGKNKKYRPVYFDEIVRSMVEAYLDQRKDSYKPLFMSNQNRRLGPSRVENMLHEVARRTGIEKRVTPHILRHSFVSDLGMNNAPIGAISKLVGHSGSDITLRIYTHVLDKQAQSVFSKHHTKNEYETIEA